MSTRDVDVLTAVLIDGPREEVAAYSASFMDRTLEYVDEIVELVPGERLTMSTRQGPSPMRTTYTWESQGESTRMSRPTPRTSSRSRRSSRPGRPAEATRLTCDMCPVHFVVAPLARSLFRCD